MVFHFQVQENKYKNERMEYKYNSVTSVSLTACRFLGKIRLSKYICSDTCVSIEILQSEIVWMNYTQIGRWYGLTDYLRGPFLLL